MRIDYSLTDPDDNPIIGGIKNTGPLIYQGHLERKYREICTGKLAKDIEELYRVARDPQKFADQLYKTAYLIYEYYSSTNLISIDHAAVVSTKRLLDYLRFPPGVFADNFWISINTERGNLKETNPVDVLRTIEKYRNNDKGIVAIYTSIKFATPGHANIMIFKPRNNNTGENEAWVIEPNQYRDMEKDIDPVVINIVETNPFDMALQQIIEYHRGGNLKPGVQTATDMFITSFLMKEYCDRIGYTFKGIYPNTCGVSHGGMCIFVAAFQLAQGNRCNTSYIMNKQLIEYLEWEYYNICQLTKTQNKRIKEIISKTKIGWTIKIVIPGSSKMFLRTGTGTFTSNQKTFNLQDIPKMYEGKIIKGISTLPPVEESSSDSESNFGYKNRTKLINTEIKYLMSL